MTKPPSDVPVPPSRWKIYQTKAIEDMQPWIGNSMCELVDLDERRDAASQKATVSRRRHLRVVLTAQEALHLRREALESHMLATPAASWHEASAKALYLIQLFSATPEAQTTARKQLIAQSLSDMSRLVNCDVEKATPGRTAWDMPKTRACLRCKTDFQSEWSGERICSQCKRSESWRSGEPRRPNPTCAS